MSARERPILFTTEMVRAILGGRKTQTRRIIKPQPIYALHDEPSWRAGLNDMLVDDCGHQLKYPYGKPGDLLWVRETWAASKGGQQIDGHIVWIDKPGAPNLVWYRATDNVTLPRWRPSIYMPRWASRITLEVLRIRVERLQKISQADARAEGVDPVWKDVGAQAPGGYRYEEPDYVKAFANLWDTIHFKPKPVNRNPYTSKREACFVSYPWENIKETREKGESSWYVVGNPWVWVVEFKRVE